MGDSISAQGHCLCKAVSFNADAVSVDIGVCHCNMCRRWSGGPYIGVDCGTEVKFSGEISHYDSSTWAEREFCSNCGTHLYYRFKDSGQLIMPAGLFNNHQGLKMDHQIFIDEKPDYYDFSNLTNNMTGAEVMAMFNSSSEN